MGRVMERDINQAKTEPMIKARAVSPTDVVKCRVSCDHIPRRSWALFRARDVMRGVIESFKAEQAA